MEIKQFVGDETMPPYLVTYLVEISDFLVKDEVDNWSYDAQAIITVETIDSGSSVTTFSGDIFNSTHSSIGTARLTDFIVRYSTFIGTDESEWGYSGTMDIGELDGFIRYETTIPMRRFGDMNSYTGVMEITGDRSGATVTILDAVNLIIDIDLDGDGSTDQNLTTTWEQL